MGVFYFITETEFPNLSKLQLLYVVAVTRKEILPRKKEGYFCLSNIFIKLCSIFSEQYTFVQQSEECPYSGSVQSSVTYSAHRSFRVRKAVIWAVIIRVF